MALLCSAYRSGVEGNDGMFGAHYPAWATLAHGLNEDGAARRSFLREGSRLMFAHASSLPNQLQKCAAVRHYWFCNILLERKEKVEEVQERRQTDGNLIFLFRGVEQN